MMHWKLKAIFNLGVLRKVKLMSFSLSMFLHLKFPLLNFVKIQNNLGTNRTLLQLNENDNDNTLTR